MAKTLLSLILCSCAAWAPVPQDNKRLDLTELNAIKTRLLHRFDPGYPVVVRIQHVPMTVGTAVWDDDLQSYVITVDPDVVAEGQSYLQHVMAHEWAHIMVWDATGDGHAHDALWGVSFARAYSALVED